MPEEIDRDMLSPANNEFTEDSDPEMQKSMEAADLARSEEFKAA